MKWVEKCSVIDRSEWNGYHRKWVEYRVFGIKIYTGRKSGFIKDTIK